MTDRNKEKETTKEVVRAVEAIRPDLNYGKLFDSYNLQRKVVAQIASQLEGINKMAAQAIANSMAGPLIVARENMIKSMQGVFSAYPVPTVTEKAVTESTEAVEGVVVDAETVAHDQAEKAVDLLIQKEVTFPDLIEYKSGSIHINDRLIDFRPRNGLQQLLIQALIEESDLNGYCSYQKIDKYFVKNRRPTIVNHDGQVKRIHNALESLYRSHKRRLSFPRKAPDGQPIIRVHDGEGLTLHNPKRMDYVFVLQDGKQQKLTIKHNIS